MYRSTIPTTRIGVTGVFEGRLSIFAIGAFLLLSAGIALANVVIPERAPSLSGSPVVNEAEDSLREIIDDRVHMHLKRLSRPG